MSKGFDINWQMSKDIQDNILYQKWSVKTNIPVQKGWKMYVYATSS